MAMPVFVKESQNRALTNTTITVTHSPAAPSTNVLLAFIHQDTAVAGAAVTTPSGWTPLTAASGGAADKLWPYWRFGDGATTAWQWTNGGTSCDIVGIILEYSTVAAVPIDTSGSSAGVGTSANAPTLSPTNAQGNFVLVAAFANNGFADAFPAPTAGTGTRTQRNTAVGTDDDSSPTDVWDWTGVGAANPTGTKTSSPISSLTWEGYAVAIAGTSAGVAVIPRVSERPVGPTSRAFKMIQRRPVVPAAVVDVTIALTGVAATSAVGSLGVQIDVPLVGVSSATAAGSLGVQHNNALTGVSSTTAAGSLAPSTAVGLTGVVATGSGGTLAPATTVALAGVAGAASVGTISPNTTVAITGVGSTLAAGSVAPETSIELSGVEVLVDPGSVVASGGDPPPASSARRSIRYGSSRGFSQYR